MTDFILHHYEISPFSAKIRALLGYCGMPWQSVLTSPMPPRPLVDALAGGYRRVPVAQVGADIFCDSRLIAEEVAQLAARPALSLANVEPAQRELAERAELEVFFACVRQAAGWPLLRRVLKDDGPLTLVRLLRDRAGMAKRMTEPRVQVKDPASVLRTYLDDLESQLTDDFLSGSSPTVADFSAWHGLWFAVVVGKQDLLSAHPRVQAWLARMNAFDDGKRANLSGQQALDAARATEPRPLPDDAGEDALLGQKVLIAPSDYAQDPVEGTLVASLPERFILRREAAEVGVVHVHLPRERFVVETTR